MSQKITPPEERIWHHVHKTRKCWLWTASVNNVGRPVMNVGAGVIRLVSRFMYEMTTGEKLGKRVVMHTCDEGLCVNPAHLKAGTQRDNIYDCMAKGRDRKACGVDNGRSKLNPQKIRVIRRSSASSRALAKQLGVGRSAVLDVRAGKTWRNV